MTLVVDASVAVKWFVEEDGSDRALQLLESGEPIVAPDLVLAEMVNAAWKSLRRGELDPGQFDQMVSDTTVTFSRLVPLDGLVRRAAAIALELDHPVYDCF